MSKLPPLKRLVLEDLPSDVQGWAPKLIEPLNEFMAAVSGGLDRKLTLAENCVAQFRTLTITIDGDNGGSTTANGTGTAGSLAKWTETDTIGDATAADVPDLPWSKITSGKPTTLSGYGITDAAPLFKPTFSSDITVAGWSSLGHTATPAYQLDLGTTLANTKISLYGGTYGIGVQSSQMRLHVNGSGAKFSFLDGAAGTEIGSLSGAGDLAISGKLTIPASGAASFSLTNTSKVVSDSRVTASTVVQVTSRTADHVYVTSVTTGQFTVTRPGGGVSGGGFFWTAVG